MAIDIFDAVYGSVVGGAIGDALGVPVEMWSYPDIREKFGKLQTFVETEKLRSRGRRVGEITDDTTLAHYISLAIVRKGDALHLTTWLRYG